MREPSNIQVIVFKRKFNSDKIEFNLGGPDLFSKKYLK